MLTFNCKTPSQQEMYFLDKKTKGTLAELIVTSIFMVRPGFIIGDVKADNDGVDLLVRCTQQSGNVEHFSVQVKMHTNVKRAKNNFVVQRDGTWNGVGKNLSKKGENFVLVCVDQDWNKDCFTIFYITKKQMLCENSITNKQGDLSLRIEKEKIYKKYQTIDNLIDRMKKGLPLEATQCTKNNIL